jgi:hypothetical protein
MDNCNVSRRGAGTQRIFHHEGTNPWGTGIREGKYYLTTDYCKKRKRRAMKKIIISRKDAKAQREKSINNKIKIIFKT